MKTPLTVAVAQLNCVVGDLSGNARRILDAVTQAKAAGADVVLTPELALCGYPPEDLLLRPAFLQACADELAALAVQVQGVTVLVGYPAVQGGSRYNAAAVIRDGRVIATYFKHRLPNYEVFDEERYFEPGLDACVFDLKGVKVGVNICADVWESGAAEVARNAGAELLLVLNASPFHMNKQQLRYEVMRERIADTGLPVVYCNLVGGQDELVFDGGSFALDGEGVLAWQGAMFAEELSILHFADGVWQERALPTARPEEADVYDALVLGVRDYLGKNGFPGALIGLSGGVDSALTLAIAVDALGADKVRAVMMPSPYTAQMSLDDSREMVRRIGVRYDEIAIEPAMRTFADMLAPQFAGLPEDTTEENLQSRIRGMLLMALSNKTGAIVLTTGNKSEMAVGYATLYGDMAGGFDVLKDVPKTLVFKLCEYRNSVDYVIPQRVIDRPPSAELAPDQVDQDSLPPYDILDAILKRYVEEDASVADMVAEGFEEAVVRKVIRLVDLNEYKRRQAAVGPRITARNFGKDRRYPITSGFGKQNW